jgi:PEP-CTERM motif-containing protein
MMIGRKLVAVAGFVAALVLEGILPAKASLVGEYFTVGSGPSDVDNALSLIAGMTPTATFNASTICFPSCTPTSINYTSLSNNVSDLSNHVLVLTGYLYIPVGGIYNFDLFSDDGSRLLIDNILSVEKGAGGIITGPHFGVFNLSAGFHQIEVVQFEDLGETGLALLMKGEGIDPSLLVASVPEPSTWVMMLFGFAGLGVVTYRKGRKAAYRPA